MAFDPTRFGFTEYKRRGAGCVRVHGCYLRITQGDKRQLELVIDKDAKDLVIKNLGDRVGTALDEKGRVLIWSDPFGRKVSESSKAHAEKATVSLSSMTAEYIEKMGNFVRLYMDYDKYAGGEAIVFTPTGERDMR